jgi:hypothetical protein
MLEPRPGLSELCQLNTLNGAAQSETTVILVNAPWATLGGTKECAMVKLRAPDSAT